jgi:hypothetical protein
MTEPDDQSKTYNWMDLFKRRGFLPTKFGGLTGMLDDIEITAIQHPFKGVSVTAQYISPREMCEVENFIPEQCTVEVFEFLFEYILRQIHSERFRKPLPPPRERPSKEEALQKAADLIRQLHGIFDELSFLSRLSFMPEGSLDHDIGKTVVAYVYDLEFNGPYGAARSSDGRTVQVKTTRSRTGTIAIKEGAEQLLVIQLWGREVGELYNGPTLPIWEIAGKPQKDGERRVSRGCLSRLNRKVPPEQKVEPKRTWKFDLVKNEEDEWLQKLSRFL